MASQAVFQAVFQAKIFASWSGPMCLSIWMSAWRVKKPSHFLVSYYPIGTGSKPTDHKSNAPCCSSSAAALGAARRTVARGTPGDCAGSTETERGGVSEYHRLCCPNNGCMNYSAHTTFDHVYLDCRVLHILSVDGASFLGQNYSVKVYFIVKVIPKYLTCLTSQFFMDHIYRNVVVFGRLSIACTSIFGHAPWLTW